MNSENKILPVNLFSTFYVSPESKYANSKTPIIFVHGFLSTPYCWNKVKNRISDKTGRKTYAVALRNHGSSDWSDEFSVDHVAADLKNFMMKENIPKAILVGHSFGAKVAIVLALKEPEMVEKLVVEDMDLTLDEEHLQVGKEFQATLQLAAISLRQFPTSLSEPVAQKKLQQLFCLSWSNRPNEKTASKPVTPILPFHKEKSGKFVWDVNMDGLLEALNHAEKFIIHLGEDSIFPGETLFIGAEYSTFNVMNDKHLITKHFPNSTITIAKGVYHTYHIEKPDGYVEEVVKFIGS